MLIAVDIGNTNIVFGIYQDKKLVKKWRFISDKKKSIDDFAVDLIEVLASVENASEENAGEENQIYQNHFEEDKNCFGIWGPHKAGRDSCRKQECFGIDKISAIIIASVVPVLTAKIRDAFAKFCDAKILVIGDENVKIDLEIDLKNKSEIGDDRIINSVAAIEKYGFPIQIIDFGTATTIDVVSNDKKYLGGVIAPGINLSLKALHDMTAKLPKIEIKKQPNVIGKNTVEAMNSGVYFGYISMISGLVEKIEKELGYKTKKIITGGLSVLFADELSYLIEDICLDLTLDGLHHIYLKNLKN